MNKLASWEALTGTHPTIESDRTIATISFPLKSAIQRKTESGNVPVNGAKSGAKNGAKTTPRQNAILSLMANNPEITLDEIAKEIGVGTTTLDREIAKMTHLVQRIGSKKGGYWEIINK